MDSNQTPSSINRWSNYLAVGPLLGVLAYGVNYGAMWILLAVDGATWEESYGSVVVSDPMPKFTGQILYNAQFVGTRHRGDAGTVSIRNLVTDTSFQENITSTVPGIIYHTVPILVLVVAGYLFYQHNANLSSRSAAAKIGLSITPGYLLLSIVGVVLFVLTGGFVVSRPDPLPAVLIGILYPALWSGTGAMIGYKQHSE